MIFGYFDWRFDFLLFMVNIFLYKWVLYILECRELNIFLVSVLGLLLLWGVLEWVYIKNIGGRFGGNNLELDVILLFLFWLVKEVIEVI